MKEIEDKHIVVAVQVGPIRLIGQMEVPQVVETGKEHWFTLKKFGVLSIMRGQRPGTVQGVTQEVKLLTLATLDFALGPIEKMTIKHYDFMIKEEDIKNNGADDMHKMYLGFLNRGSSIVEHIRTDGGQP